ncbi:MAG TPA: allantoicase [Woeseiaceae bacterium]|nr:allantoicase [Woeseiaceae bacterium]
MNKHPFYGWVQLEQPRLGGKVTFASDEFFAAKERIIDPAEPVFIAGKFDDHGKWMDGWESRRKRTPGHDFCIVRLGMPGVIRGLDIDTSHFSGNFPPEVSIDGCVSDDDVPEDGWVTLLPKFPIEGNSHNYVPLQNDDSWSHLRVNIYPDGGIARLRVFGEVRPALGNASDLIDLAALKHGGRVLSASDEHFGSMHNLNLPGRGVNMGDGWETARRRGPGHDWAIVALAAPGTIERIEVDTAHFKGNYPDRVSFDAAYFASNDGADNVSGAWRPLLGECKLAMDQQHYFEQGIQPLGVVSHVRMCIYPDGGVSRLRLFGRPAMEKPA